MKFAAIDIGSNAVRLLICRVTEKKKGKPKKVLVDPDWQSAAWIRGMTADTIASIVAISLKELAIQFVSRVRNDDGSTNDILIQI